MDDYELGYSRGWILGRYNLIELNRSEARVLYPKAFSGATGKIWYFHTIRPQHQTL
jgi:hypothetical protein